MADEPAIKRVYVLGAGSSISHSKEIFPSTTQFFPAARDAGLANSEDAARITQRAKAAKTLRGYKTFGVDD